jgi:hypothetical protein
LKPNLTQLRTLVIPREVAAIHAAVIR